jgi:hypothetical protein
MVEMRNLTFLRLVFLLIPIIAVVPRSSAAQNAAPMLVNYQGELTSPTTGEPVPDGLYNIVFRIYDAESGGILLWQGTHSDVNGNPVEVTNGIFSVILGSGTGNALDASVFGGSDRWLEIRIRMETLSPRQKIASVAYSLVSENSRLLAGREASEFANSTHVHSGSQITSGTVSEARIDPLIARDTETNTAITAHTAIPGAHHSKTTKFSELTDMAADTQIPGSIARDSEIMPTVLGADGPRSTLDADYLDGNDSSAFSPAAHTHDSRYWGLTGNTGTDPATHFIGTFDYQAFEVRVGNYRVLRLEPNVDGPNILAGHWENSIPWGIRGATISGGGRMGSPNRVTYDYGTIGGGGGNQAGDNAGTTDDAHYATVGGGRLNTAIGAYASVAGGLQNSASADFATVAGGELNTASDNCASVGGGYQNVASGMVATVPGGEFNEAIGYCSFAAGSNAHANGAGSFVWADRNASELHAWNSNEFVVRATGGFWLITKIDGTGYPIEGMMLPAGSSHWVPIGSTAAQLSPEESDRVQELEAENTNLKQRMDDLESRLAALEALMQ